MSAVSISRSGPLLNLHRLNSQDKGQRTITGQLVSATNNSGSSLSGLTGPSMSTNPAASVNQPVFDNRRDAVKDLETKALLDTGLEASAVDGLLDKTDRSAIKLREYAAIVYTLKNTSNNTQHPSLTQASSYLNKAVAAYQSQGEKGFSIGFDVKNSKPYQLNKDLSSAIDTAVKSQSGAFDKCAGFLHENYLKEGLGRALEKSLGMELKEPALQDSARQGNAGALASNILANQMAGSVQDNSCASYGRFISDMLGQLGLIAESRAPHQGRGQAMNRKENERSETAQGVPRADMSTTNTLPGGGNVNVTVNVDMSSLYSSMQPLFSSLAELLIGVGNQKPLERASDQSPTLPVSPGSQGLTSREPARNYASESALGAADQPSHRAARVTDSIYARRDNLQDSVSQGSSAAVFDFASSMTTSANNGKPNPASGFTASPFKPVAEERIPEFKLSPDYGVDDVDALAAQEFTAVDVPMAALEETAERSKIAQAFIDDISKLNIRNFPKHAPIYRDFIEPNATERQMGKTIASFMPGSSEGMKALRMYLKDGGNPSQAPESSPVSAAFKELSDKSPDVAERIKMLFNSLNGFKQSYTVLPMISSLGGSTSISGNSKPQSFTAAQRELEAKLRAEISHSKE